MHSTALPRTLEGWLNRPPPKKGRKGGRIRSASPKRAKQLKEYAKLRRAFLAKNPYCQIWMKRAGVRRCDIDEDGCILDGGYMFVPLAKEIHHRKGRVGELLNDTRWWLAVSREGHVWCHEHPSEARRQGFIL